MSVLCHPVLLSARARLGLSRREVAEAAGMSEANYARIESREVQTPHVTTARRLARVLDLPARAVYHPEEFAEEA